VQVDAGAGALGYIGGAANVGPAWNVRVTGRFTPRWAVEGNYTGSVNQRVTVAQNSLVYTSLDAGVRYNILRADQAPIQPYVVGGVGYAGFAGQNGDGAALVLPVTVGAERMITNRINAGARFSLRPTFGDNLGIGRTSTGGDSWNVIVHLGGGF